MRSLLAGGACGLAAFWAILLVAFLATWVLPVTALLAQEQPREIVLGMSAPFTGPARGLGYELYRGAMAAFQEEQRLHPGALPPVRLHCRDDGYNPSNTLKNTIRFLQEGVFSLFGYVGTPTTLRILPLLARRDSWPMSLLFPFTGASLLREGPQAGRVAHLRASYFEETQQLVSRLLSIGRRRIAVFYQADSFGRSGWEAVRRALARRGLSIHSEATYRRTDDMGANYASAMARIAPAGMDPPDAIICVGLYGPTAGFIRDARRAGLASLIVTMSIVDTDNLLLCLRQEGERLGTPLTANIVGSQVVPSYEEAHLPAVQAYRQAMERVEAPTPDPERVEAYTPLRYSLIGLEGYLNARVFLEALRRMDGHVERERLLPTLQQMNDYDVGIDAPLGFSQYSSQGLSRIYFSVFSNDRITPLQGWEELAP